MQSGKRILSIKIIHDEDEQNTGEDFLGTYSNEPENEYSIDREERGDKGRGEYRYFNASRNYCKEDGTLCDGNTPEMVREYVEQDYKRSEGRNRGDWGFVGVRAEAEITVQGIRQEISSSGLWGIESDSDDAYFKEVEGEELHTLKTILKDLGFSSRALSEAFKKVVRP